MSRNPRPIHYNPWHVQFTGILGMKNFNQIKIFSSILFLSIFLPSAWAVNPSMEVRDSNGDIVGPVVGFTASFAANPTEEHSLMPVIPLIDDITDPETPIPVITTVVSSTELSAGDVWTYFLTDDCTGDAYHGIRRNPNTTPQNLYPMTELTGVSHSIARRGGGNMELFASKLSDPTISISHKSVYFRKDYSDEIGCGHFTNGLINDVRPATAIKTLNYSTPFQASFVVDDGSVALAATTTNDVRVGTIIDISATYNQCLVKLD